MRQFTRNDTSQYPNGSHKTSFIYIENNTDRLGSLPSTHGQRSQERSGRITFQPVLINNPNFLEDTRYTEIRKIVVTGFMAVKALNR